MMDVQEKKPKRLTLEFEPEELHNLRVAAAKKDMSMTRFAKGCLAECVKRANEAQQ
jgi:hypothetical protein